jgi:hypothetical protein
MAVRVLFQPSGLVCLLERRPQFWQNHWVVLMASTQKATCVDEAEIGECDGAATQRFLESVGDNVTPQRVHMFLVKNPNNPKDWASSKVQNLNF